MMYLHYSSCDHLSLYMMYLHYSSCDHLSLYMMQTSVFADHHTTNMDGGINRASCFLRHVSGGQWVVIVLPDISCLAP